MNVPESIQRKCMDYRALFPTDQRMGESLGISAQHARRLVSGGEFPSLDVMIVIQEGLQRKQRARRSA